MSASSIDPANDNRPPARLTRALVAAVAVPLVWLSAYAAGLSLVRYGGLNFL